MIRSVRPYIVLRGPSAIRDNCPSHSIVRGCEDRGVGLLWTDVSRNHSSIAQAPTRHRRDFLHFDRPFVANGTKLRPRANGLASSRAIQNVHRPRTGG